MAALVYLILCVKRSSRLPPSVVCRAGQSCLIGTGCYVVVADLDCYCLMANVLDLIGRSRKGECFREKCVQSKRRGIRFASARPCTSLWDCIFGVWVFFYSLLGAQVLSNKHELLKEPGVVLGYVTILSRDSCILSRTFSFFRSSKCMHTADVFRSLPNRRVRSGWYSPNARDVVRVHVSLHE